MNLARILYPVRVLGPGNRIGLWLCGCTRGCKGCSNPELWQQKPEDEISVSDVLSLVEKISSTHSVDGFTISGGEPFHQAGDLSHLIECLHKISSDILVYTGYERKELQARQDVATDAVLRSIAVLIDGAYREDLNDNSFLRGSSNQHIHILNPTYEGYYREYLQNGHNQIQNFSTSDGIISVGIHRKTF